MHNPAEVLYGRLPGFHLSDLGRADGRADRRARARRRDITYVVSSPLERAQETAAPIAEALGLDVATDDRLIEAGNVFEGKTFGVGDGVAAAGREHWLHLRNPLRPSWGEPYVEIAAPDARRDRRRARRRARPRGAAASATSCRSGRPGSFATGRRLWHDPRKRQCSLASLTSFTYDGDELVSVSLRGAGPRPAAGAGADREEVRRRRMMPRTHRSSRGPRSAVRPSRRSLLLGWRGVLTGCSGGRGRRCAGRATSRGDGTVRPWSAAPTARTPVAAWPAPRSTASALDVARPPRCRSSSSTSGAPGARRARARRPRSRRSHEQTEGEGVQFVGVDTERPTAAAARAHERRFGVTYPSIDDDGGRVLLAFRGTLPPNAIPTTLVLDREGRVAARVLGRVDASTLRGLVDDASREEGSR